MPSAGTMGIEMVATRADYIEVINAVESKQLLKYVRYDLSDSPVVEAYERGRDIASLGTARHGIAVRETTYLVMPRHCQVVVTPIPQFKGGVLYDVSPLDHPGSVMLHTGGVYNTEVLISGTVSTALTDPGAIATMRDFRREIRNRFTRIEAFWFGPEALSLFHSGMRATQDIRNVPELDIGRNPLAK